MKCRSAPSRPVRRRLILATAIFLLLAAGYGSLHTDLVRRRAAAWISATLSERLDGEFRITGIGGVLPFVLHAERIAWTTAAGEPRLDIARITVRINLDSIRRRRILLHSLTADAATYRHLDRAAPDDEPFRWDHLPAGGVETFHIGRLDIAFPSWPTNAVMDARGRISHRDPAGGSYLQLTASNTCTRLSWSADRPDGAAPWVCTLSANVCQDSAVNALVSLPATLAWRGDAASTGRWDAATGRIQWEAPRFAHVDVEFDWTHEAGGSALELAGRVRVAEDRLPAGLVRSTGHQVSGACRLTKQDATPWRLDQATIQAGRHQLQVWESLPDADGERTFDLRLMAKQLEQTVWGHPLRVDVLQSDGQLHLAPPRTTLEWRAHLQHVDGLPPNPAAFLGHQPEIAGRIMHEPGAIRVQSTTIEGVAGRLSAQGHYELETGNADLSWRAELAPRPALPFFDAHPWACPQAPWACEGTLRYDAAAKRLNGGLQSSELVTEAAELGAVDFRFAYPVRTDTPLLVSGQVDRLTVGLLRTEDASIEGRFGSGRHQVNLTLRGALAERRRFEAEAAYHHGPDESAVRLVRFEAPDPTWPIILESPARIELDGDELELRGFSVRAGVARLGVSGAIRDEQIQGRVRLSPVRLVELPLGGVLDGLAEGELALGGTLGRPTLNGTLVLGELQTRQRPNEGTGTGSARFDFVYSDGRLEARAELEMAGAAEVQAQAEWPFALRFQPWRWSPPPRDAGAAAVKGWLDLGTLNALPFMTRQRLHGQLTFDVAASGFPPTTRWAGRGAIRDGRFEHLTMGSDFRDLRADIEAKEGILVLRSLSAQDSFGAELTGEGRVECRPEAGFPFGLTADLQDIRLLSNDLLTASAKGTLSVTGTTEAIMVDGSLSLAPVEILIPKPIPLTSRSIRIVDPAQEQASRDPAEDQTDASRIRLRVQVTVPARMNVYGRGLKSEWKGSLKVAGSAERPRLTGTLEAVRGRFNFFGVPLQLTAGAVRFRGGYPPQPELHLVFERSSQDSVIFLQIDGPAADAVITLSSEPALPEDEILPRLLFGKSVTELSAFQVVRIAQATRALQGHASSFQLMDRAQQWLSVDQLDLDESDAPGGLAKVTVGKYLGENLYVQGENQLIAGSGRLTLELEVTPRISLETHVDADMKQGIGIKFKRRF